jgi:subtilisin family serine protease
MFVRSVLTAGLAAMAAVIGFSGAADAATPAALPTGTIVAAPGAETIRDSYIVVLKTGSAAAGDVTSASQALAKRYGGEVRNNYLATVRGFQAAMTATEAAHLAADPSVAYVQQDAKVSIDATQSGATWGIDRLDQKALPLSTTYTYGTASGVTAYVLDTGIRISHSDFGGRATYGWNFINGNADASDCNGHGTHVAGTIGGRTYGVTKDVKLVAVKVLDCTGSGSYSAIMAGVDWVTAHAVKPAVANMSLGGPVYQALNDAVTRSIASGVTYAVAAGNDNKNACQQSPAVTPNAITVGATESTDARASFSNYGTCVDIFAPGSRITSDSNSSNTATKMMSGTSMASPHVAGAAALVLGAHPAWTPAQVRDALVTNADSGVVSSAGTGSPNKLLYTGWLATTTATSPVVARAAACAPVSHGTDVALKARSTVASAVRVSCTGTASTASVSVAMKTTFRGSLRITLVSPAGREYAVKAVDYSDKAGSFATRYAVAVTGAPRSGVWTLRVTDKYGSAGTLDSWTLQL